MFATIHVFVSLSLTQWTWWLYVTVRVRSYTLETSRDLLNLLDMEYGTVLCGQSIVLYSINLRAPSLCDVSCKMKLHWKPIRNCFTWQLYGWWMADLSHNNIDWPRPPSWSWKRPLWLTKFVIYQSETWHKSMPHESITIFVNDYTGLVGGV